jgi:hypothetical protein
MSYHADENRRGFRIIEMGIWWRLFLGRNGTTRQRKEKGQ